MSLRESCLSFKTYLIWEIMLGFQALQKRTQLAPSSAALLRKFISNPSSCMGHVWTEKFLAASHMWRLISHSVVA